MVTIRFECVNGELIDKVCISDQMIETTWKTWKTMYPNSLVVSDDNGYDRDYTNYPYGDYKTNDDYLLFSVTPEDSRLASKERVLIVTSPSLKTYRFTTFANEMKIILDDNQMIIGSEIDNFIVGFESEIGRTFSTVQGKLPIVLEDNEGNEYDIFGEAISGPRKGEYLVPVESYISYWFAAGAFNPEITIYE